MLECPKGRIQRQQVSVKATLPCRGENKTNMRPMSLSVSLSSREAML